MWLKSSPGSVAFLLGTIPPQVRPILLFLAGVCPWLRVRRQARYECNIGRSEANCHPLTSIELLIQALLVPRTQADLEGRGRWPTISLQWPLPGWVYKLHHFPGLRRHTALAHLWAASALLKGAPSFPPSSRYLLPSSLLPGLTEALKQVKPLFKHSPDLCQES